MRRDEACLSSQWKMAPSNFERGLKFIDGGLRDVIGDLLSVFGPEVVAEVRDVRLWHRR